MGGGIVTGAENIDALLDFMQDCRQFDRLRAETLAAMASALPPDAGRLLKETADLITATAEARWSLVEETIRPYLGNGRTTGRVAWQALRLLAWPYEGRPGYRQEWKP